MINPAYIVYRLDTGLIVYVCSWEYELDPNIYGIEYGDWPKNIGDRWGIYKCYRDDVNTYRITEDLHVDLTELLNIASAPQPNS